MLYRGHVVDKITDVYNKTFPVRSKKEFIALLRVSYCWYLIVTDVEMEKFA